MLDGWQDEPKDPRIGKTIIRHARLLGVRGLVAALVWLQGACKRWLIEAGKPGVRGADQSGDKSPHSKEAPMSNVLASFVGL